MRNQTDQGKTEHEPQPIPFVDPVTRALYPHVLNPHGLMPSQPKTWKPEAKEQWRQDSFI